MGNNTTYDTKDLPSLVPFALGWQTRVFFISEIILSSIGLIAGFTVLFVFLKAGIKNQSSYNILLMILVGIDVLFHVLTIWEVSQNASNDGYSLGKTGCIVQSILHEYFAASSIFLCLAISIERYCAIVKKFLLNKMDLLKVLVLISVPVLLMCLFPTITNSNEDAYALSVSRVLCYGNWSSYKTFPLIHTVLGLIILVVGLILTTIFYVLIYLYMSKNHSREIPVSSGHSRVFENPTTPAQKLLSRKMLIQSTIICITLVLSWTPLLISMLYQIGTGNQLPPDFDLFSFVFVTLGATMNGFIVLILDRRVANTLKGMEIVTKVVQIKQY